MITNRTTRLLLLILSTTILASCEFGERVCEVEPEYTTGKVLDLNEELMTKNGVNFRRGENIPFNGYEIERYDNCQIGILATYEDGFITKLEEWSEDGQNLSKASFKNKSNKIHNHGTWTYWYENGGLESKSNWQDNLKHGLDTAWHENGIKAYEVNYVNGQKQGVESRWHESGATNSEVQYSDGKPIGVVKVWDEEGELLDERKVD